MGMLSNLIQRFTALFSQKSLERSFKPVGKRDRSKNKSGKETWDLLQSYGDGTGLFKCRQTKELGVFHISQSSLRAMSYRGRKWFTGNKEMS